MNNSSFIKVFEELSHNPTVLEVLDLLKICKQEGKTVFVAGNGGSACESDHFVAELIGINHRAISLNSNQAVLTALSNDFGYEEVFAHQLGILGERGDLFIGLTTSGNSANLIRALRVAGAYEIKSVVLTGQVSNKLGGKVSSLANYAIIIESNNVQVIQEVHLKIIHFLYNKLKK